MINGLLQKRVLVTQRPFIFTYLYISTCTQLTLHAVSISETALRLKLAVAMTSSCLQEFPAATALAVAAVIPLVMRIDCSGVVFFSGISFEWKT